MSSVPPVLVETITGGVATPKGFRAAGVSAGIKARGGLDLALIVSDRVATAAAVWLGWPLESARHTRDEALKRPTTLAELNAYYPAVPPDRNMAPAIEKLAAENATRQLAYWQSAQIGRAHV